MIREVRESGSKPSSGKHSASISAIHNLSKEELSVKAPFSEQTSLEQLMIDRSLRFDGKPPSGNDSSTEQPSIVRVWRFDGKPLSGNDLSLGISFIIKVWRFDGKPLSGNDSSTVGYEARTNWVGLSRHHVLVSGLNHCVPLLSLFISI